MFSDNIDLSLYGGLARYIGSSLPTKVDTHGDSVAFQEKFEAWSTFTRTMANSNGPMCYVQPSK